VGNERQITNVAAGTQATDAVNLAQLNSVASSLSYQIANVRNGAYSAAAASMAVQSAPYVPGHTTLRLGGGSYGGQGAVGLTMRRTSDDGSWSIDGGVTTTSFETGGQIGISVVLP
jgi:trimeric autotransporter adhesin